MIPQAASSPGFELRQFAHKGPKLLVRLGRERWALQLGIHLGSEESQQQIQVVDAKRIRYNVEPVAWAPRRGKGSVSRPVGGRRVPTKTKIQSQRPQCNSLWVAGQGRSPF